MKKTAKLSLNRETLRALADRQLGRAHGGGGSRTMPEFNCTSSFTEIGMGDTCNSACLKASYHMNDC